MTLDHTTVPRPDRPAGPSRTGVVAVLAAALLIGAVVVIRSAPTASTDVYAGSVDLADPVEPADRGGAPVGAGELPHAGLVPERTDAMRALVGAMAVGPSMPGTPPPGAFGPTPGHCVERDALLPRDLSPVTYHPDGSGCRVARGVLDDPYLGRSARYTDERSDRVAVDRIVSSAYAWQHGAADWSPAKRAAFALDRRNQLVVDARQAVAKDGRGPAAWLPPNVAIRCAYVARFAEIAAAYQLTVTAEDREVARRQCLAA